VLLWLGSRSIDLLYQDGIDWGDDAVVNCQWRGPRLRNVLLHSGLRQESTKMDMLRLLVTRRNARMTAVTGQELNSGGQWPWIAR
jgi:hypothetical protein